jgi:hypothetical protein
MVRALKAVGIAALLLAAYEAGQRHVAVEFASMAEPAGPPSVARHLVTPVWPGADREPAPSAEDHTHASEATRGNSIRLLGPGIRRDRQIRV